MVTADYSAAFAAPLAAAAGDVVSMGRLDADYPGWVWCRSAAGMAGWTPVAYLDSRGDLATLKCDYNAAELTVKAGAWLTVLEEESGWALCSTAAGEQGWVPLANLAPV
jgi:hypothetical protein